MLRGTFVCFPKCHTKRVRKKSINLPMGKFGKILEEHLAIGYIYLSPTTLSELSFKQRRSRIPFHRKSHNLLSDLVLYKRVGLQPTASLETLATDLGESTLHSYPTNKDFSACRMPCPYHWNEFYFIFKKNIFLIH